MFAISQTYQEASLQAEFAVNNRVPGKQSSIAHRNTDSAWRLKNPLSLAELAIFHDICSETGRLTRTTRYRECQTLGDTSFRPVLQADHLLTASNFLLLEYETLTA